MLLHWQFLLERTLRQNTPVQKWRWRWECTRWRMHLLIDSTLPGAETYSLDEDVVMMQLVVVVALERHISTPGCCHLVEVAASDPAFSAEGRPWDCIIVCPQNSLAAFRLYQQSLCLPKETRTLSLHRGWERVAQIGNHNMFRCCLEWCLVGDGWRMALSCFFV